MPTKVTFEYLWCFCELDVDFRCIMGILILNLHAHLHVMHAHLHNVIHAHLHNVMHANLHNVMHAHLHNVIHAHLHNVMHTRCLSVGQVVLTVAHFPLFFFKAITLFFFSFLLSYVLLIFKRI